MDKERDIFDDWLRDRFDDYTEEPSEGLFERIKESIDEVKPAAVPLNGARRVWRWVGIAAAVALVAGSAVMIESRIRQRESTEPIATIEQRELTEPDAAEQFAATDQQTNSEPSTDSSNHPHATTASGSATDNSDRAPAEHQQIARNSDNADSAIANNDAAADNNVADNNLTDKADVADNNVADNKAADRTDQKGQATERPATEKPITKADREAYRRLLNGQTDPSMRSPRKRTDGRLTASLYAADYSPSTGNINMSGEAVLRESKMLVAEAVEQPNSASVITGDRRFAAPQHIITPSQEPTLSHSKPLNFGLRFSYALSDRWSVESGLNLSLLKSESHNQGRVSQYQLSRRLYYLGFPVNLSYDIVDTRYFDLYVKGGAMIERCISHTEQSTIDNRKLQSDSYKGSGIQPSVSIAAGAMLNITRFAGLYVEPGYGYWFDTGQPASYRTERPSSFTLSAGLKFSFN